MIEHIFSRCFQHLSYDIFIDISKIGAEYIIQELIVNDIFGNIALLECKRGKQNGIQSKHLKVLFVKAYLTFGSSE